MQTTIVHRCPATGCRRLTLRLHCDHHRDAPSPGATAARLEAAGLTPDQADALAQRLVGMPLDRLPEAQFPDRSCPSARMASVQPGFFSEVEC